MASKEKRLELFFACDSFLTHFTWKPLRGSKANSADPDQTPHDVASDQGLHCWLTGFSIKNVQKRQNRSEPLKWQIHVDSSNI